MVITIVIIIILATITIKTVFDDNGIVPYAEKAKLDTETSADKEALQMLYAELYLKRTTEEHKTGNIETEEYLSFLEEKGIATKEEDGKSYASMNNKLYEVKMENGNLSVEYAEEGAITEPRIKSIIIVSQTRDSIGIKVDANRMDGGTYYYSIGTSEDAMGAEASSSEPTYTFEGLTQGNTYYIKVRAVNSNGEEAEKIISTVMEEVPDATEENVTYKISWKDGKAKVEFSTETNFKIETSKDNSIYKENKVVEDLNNGDTAYVRLSNGTYSGKEMAVQIADVTKPEITIRTTKVTTQKIEIEVIAKEEESGFEESKPYKYYISSTAEIGKDPLATNTEGKYAFENLDQNTEYYIKVEREDRAGNIGEGIITAKTELIPRAEEAVKRETKWEADGTVQITLSAGTEEAKEYTIMYSTDRADWKEYSTPISAHNGDTIYICLTDGGNNGEDYQMNIVDNEGPEIGVTRGAVNTNSITVNVKAEDKVSGMPESVEYNYYIKESTADDYTLVAEGETSATYKFTGLKAQTTYNVKVTTKDVVGNEGEGLLDATTNDFSLVTGNISFSNAIWANKEASIGITNNTEYEMQYKVFETAGEITTEGEWETAEGKTVTIEHLKDGNRVIARLYDGTNVTTYATAEIEDTIKPSIEVEGISTEWTNQNVTLTVNAEDNESGLQAEAYSFDGGKTWQAENTKEYSKNTAGIVIQVRDEAGNIATYNTVNINNIDKEGPVLNVDIETTSKTITVEILSAQDNGIGMNDIPTYTYYMATSEAGLESAEGEESTALTKTYAGLTQNTTYYIRIEAKDKLGNISKTDRTVSTGSLDASSDALKISDPTWSNKEATVKITNSAVETLGYSMDYQVVKSGGTFNQDANWTNTAEGEVTIQNLKDGDIVYARLSDGSNVSGTIQKEIEDATAPSVEVTGNSTEWTNQNITLTVNATDNESGLQAEAYSFDGGKTWQEENTKEYSQNTAGIVVQVRDEAGNIGTSETIEITKIDKEGPNIIIEEEETTTKSSRINVTGSDAGVGIEENPTYTYSYKKKTESDYTEAKQTTDTTYTYENLASNTTYNLKVTAVDKLGNVGEKEIEITTGNLLYQVGDITFSETIWNNSKASITMTNNRAEYEMEYQIGKDGAEIDLDGSWTKVTEETKEITNLEAGDIVYARLTDNVNSTEGHATCNVNNPAKASYKEEELAKNTTRGTHDILAIETSENEIQVQVNEEIEGAVLYNYYYKTINDEEYKLISTNTYYNEPAIITDVEAGVTYKIKVLAIDEDGNVTRSENTATTIASSKAEINQTYSDNKTYIDEDGYTISVPAGFKVSETAGENTQTSGVVLKDEEGNEYVWIPVNDAIYDGVTAYPTGTGSSSTYKPMSLAQSGMADYYEGMVYNYNGTLSYRNSSNTGVGKSSYREPSLVTNNANDGYTWNVGNLTGVIYDADQANYKTVLGFNSPSEYGTYLANSYNNMVTSVDTYGGFYVGRYETTMTGSGSNVIVGSKANSTVMASNNWYKMNLYQDNTRYASNPYNGKSSVATSMMWGSQWDAMLNYILIGNDKGKVTTKVGNRTNSVHNSGGDASDKINNIYDLGANVYEWTIEANGTNYRVYRGGSYDTTNSSTASTRGNSVPTDQGPAFGTRMGMYIRSTNDVTGPSISIAKVEASSNTITVEVTARDAESGVAGYKYYIGTSKGGTTLEAENNSTSYTFEGLKQNTTYYIKVEATDGAGNVGTTEEIEQKTDTFDVDAATVIKRIQKYGPNGSGVIQLELDKEYVETGYYIEYQVAANEGVAVDPNGSWTKGDIINNLSNGQKIYARINDGENGSSDYYEEVVDGLEEYAYIDASGKAYTNEEAIAAPGKTTYDTTINYTDGAGKTATIPAGFKVGTTDSVKNIDNGLVIEDAKGNQFVWVPVETAIETDKSTTSSEKAMARMQSGYGTGTAKKYYEGILYNFSGTTSTKKSGNNILGTSTMREPTMITGGADYTWNVAKGVAKGQTYDILEQYYKYMQFGTSSGVKAFNSYTEMGQYMNEEYSNMITSVDTYGGFYIARFETSYEGSTTNQNAVVQSKIGESPISNRTWYDEYYYQDSNINPKNPYYNSKSVTSSMIWGSQWDATMNWFLTDNTTKEFVTAIRGNHEDKVAKTGAYTDDLAKNIFDMSGNVAEWTQEGENTSYRNMRGGAAMTTADKYIVSTSGRYTYWRSPTSTTVPTNTTGGSDVSKNYLGSRMTLYINNTEDTTEPSITINSTEVGTNNIEVKVTAKDDESGISKYRYSVSLKNFEDSGFNEGTDVIKKEETYGNSYTFTGLNDNQTYYIRVEAINGVGKVAAAYAGPLQTEFLEIAEGAIIREKVYGKNGEGTAYFTISKDTEFEDEGYYLQYQIGKNGAAVSIDGSWTKGDTVRGLSVGDIVYTRLYDGVNVADYYMSTNISELETFSDVYQTTTKYEDYDTVPIEGGGSEQQLVGTAYIPAGFKVATSDITKKIANGLVIEDEKGNQYVWIPVKDVVYDGKTAISSTYKPMFKYQSGYSEDTAEQYFERIYYNFSGTTSSGSTGYGMGQGSYREPTLVTNSTANYSWVFTAGNNYDATLYTQLAEIGIDSPTKMGTYLNDKYTDMVESIKKYGGYYVGRHETSLFTEAGANSTSGTVVKSVQEETPMASVNWYKMYLVENSDYDKNPYHTSSSVTSQMITGGQWDTMLNFILQGSDKEKVTAVTGNHTGTRSTTGQYGSDIMNNIFDLSSNVREWTTEAYGATSRALRGGICNTGDALPASYRNNPLPTSAHGGYGSRLSLYLK